MDEPTPNVEVVWTFDPDPARYEALLRAIFDPILKGLSPTDIAHLRDQLDAGRPSQG